MGFRYRAARADGRIVTGHLVAASGEVADAELARAGLHPLLVEPAPPPTRWRGTPPRRELAVVFRSLASLVGGGVSLGRAVAATEALPRNRLLGTALAEARRRLAEGETLALALARAAGAVPPVVLGMLRAGERGSQLPAALEQAAAHLEQEAELAGQVRQALAYPAILLAAGLASLGVITVVVVPRFAVLLADLGVALPPATRALLLVAAGVRGWGPVLLPAALGAIGGVLAWGASAAGRPVRDRALLRLPLVGAVRHGLATARLCRALGGMLAAGVPLLTALDAARDAAGDAEVASRLTRARRRVEEGEGLTRAFALAETVTPAALQVLAVGDASGRLGPMALRAGDLAARDAEGRLRVLVNLLEPSLVLLFGGLVAFTAAALLQAVYSLRPG